MYTRRLNEVHKAITTSKIQADSEEISFVMEMFQKRKSEFSVLDKQKINKLWGKIKS